MIQETHVLKSHVLQKIQEEEQGSGIAPPELTPVEAALEEIIKKEKEFEKQYSSEVVKNQTKKKRLRKTRKQAKRCVRNLSKLLPARKESF